MHPPHVGQNAEHQRHGDHQPDELVGLCQAGVVGEPHAAKAGGATGELGLGGGQDQDHGGKAKGPDEGAVHVQVGDKPTDTEARQCGGQRCEGGADQELPGVSEWPVDLDVEHTEDVETEAPEPDDTEVGDPGQAHLQMDQQAEADDLHHTEGPGDEKRVKPIEHDQTFDPLLRRRPRSLSTARKKMMRTSWA